ncbi:MAG: FMN-binding negative transcriptional regulator [Deltaproteobacteria bacterium]|nr:MAG: FMN-binding negative transcriptional regulator [Deltaproteobacteria bacterium]TMQ23922.1 MAG: FMN-binding negative transcriptional regulator [Deltaproteobacteria bacterium]
MYVPSHFEETRVDVLHQLVRDHPLAVLVTHTSAGLEANHVPMEIDPEPAPFGTLRGHVSRANAMWQTASGALDALAIFQGPDHYITPAWYATKRATGKVVPTWNYAVVHAHGPLRVVDDPAWLRALVERLTNRHEAERPEPWQVTDAPADYIAAMVRAIVGIELPIRRLVGKWKASQNKSAPDRTGVADGLQAAGGPDAAAMAELVRRSPG